MAIMTRQVFWALGSYVLLGWTIIEGWNPLYGVIRSVDAIVSVLSSRDNIYLLLFSALIGAVISFTQVSGGVEGFVRWAEGRGLTRHPKRLQLFTVLVSGTIFLESWFGLLVTGSVAKPLFDRARISREKLSYILDATAAPKCILIPINAWGAYVVGLLAIQGFEKPVASFAASLPFNFYALSAIATVLLTILGGRDIGPMRCAEARVRAGGPLLREGAQPLMTQELSQVECKPETPHRPLNMLLPLLIMLAMVPTVLVITGKGDFSAGSGSQALFWGATSALFFAGLAYLLQRIVSVQELTDTFFKGVQGLIPMFVVLVLAFSIGVTTRKLGTGVFLANAAKASLPTFSIPSVIFLLGCVIAFSTGTSWGTFSIMIPIVAPMIRLLGLHPGLTLGAALGGGIFGDHCSPISDSTIVASMAAGTDHLDHVRTQLPYALSAGAVALILTSAFALLLH